MKIIVAGNAPQEFKDKLLARMTRDVVAPERASECECCGKMKYDCRDIYVPYVGDTHACADCRDYDGAGKRDYYRQDPDR